MENDNPAINTNAESQSIVVDAEGNDDNNTCNPDDIANNNQNVIINNAPHLPEEKTMLQSPDNHNAEASSSSTTLETDKSADNNKRKLRTTLKKTILVSIPFIIIIAVLVFVIPTLTNNYKTPIKNISRLDSAAFKSAEGAILGFDNGVLKKESKSFMKIMQKSEVYREYINELYANILELSSYNSEEYGSDFKVKYEIIDKTKLKSSELREYRSDTKEYFRELSDIADKSEEFNTDKLKDLADTLGMTRSNAKSAVEALYNLASTGKNVEITDGYVVDFRITITGNNLDEPIVDEDSLITLKVNGRWVAGDYYWPYIYEEVTAVLVDAIQEVNRPAAPAEAAPRG